MKVTILILGGVFLFAGSGLFFLIRETHRDVERQYSQASEEPLVDFAHLLASLVETDIKNGEIDVSRFRSAFYQAYQRDFEARIYSIIKKEIPSFVYITNRDGIVIYDSEGKREGHDYSEYNDVYLTWKGEYGVRASRIDREDSRTTVFFVAAPIHDPDGEIVGTLTVARPETAMAPFLDEARSQLIRRSLLVCSLVALAAAIWIYWILRPIRKITRQARDIAAGESKRLPITGLVEFRELSVALEEMREEIEGKHYVENYVTALTHELKSPLAAIRGSAELIQSDASMPGERKERFLQNILSETQRSEDMVRRLVQLAALENQKSLAKIEPVRLDLLIKKEVAESKATRDVRGIEVSWKKAPAEVTVSGDPILLRFAIRNILNNAIDFSPQSGRIQLTCTLEESGAAEILIEDEGNGIPHYAIDQVFDRFYSLKSRETGKKGSGIGLCFVRETMTLHGGTVGIQSEEGQGTKVQLCFPPKS